MTVNDPTMDDIDTLPADVGQWAYNDAPSALYRRGYQDALNSAAVAAAAFGDIGLAQELHDFSNELRAADKS